MGDFVGALLDVLAMGVRSEEDLYRDINYLVDHRDRYSDAEFKVEMTKLWTMYNMRVKDKYRK